MPPELPDARGQLLHMVPSLAAVVRGGDMTHMGGGVEAIWEEEAPVPKDSGTGSVWGQGAAGGQ